MSGGALIVGAGQAGFQVACSLRQAGYDGAVTVLGDERHAPYGRPALSKERLKPESELQYLRPESFFAAQRIDLRIGTSAVRVDAAGRRLHLESGEVLDYDQLVLATGATPRRLPVPGGDLAGIAPLRTAEDAERLEQRLGATARLVVVGGGFVGLEVAASARARGIAVHVLEAQDRLLARALSAPMSAHLLDVHEQAGVVVSRRSVVERFVDDGAGAVSGVVLADGATVAADTVVVGIGVVPNTLLAQTAGLAVDDGIVVDRSLRTADPAIWAIGDCARFPTVDGALVRIESVQNATDQARAAAASIVAGAGTYDAVPWFWSVQHEQRLQIAGLSTGHDRAVSRVANDGLSVFCFRGDELLAVESVGRPKDHMAARKLLAAGVRVDHGQAADPDFDLKTLVP
ncbi:MAG: FAD-dependent oxidoreductase [Patulibacter sp.]|nr:FAD-dependent oxidoreductase [Patulibacter sp.]